MWNINLGFRAEQNIREIQIHNLSVCGSDAFGTEYTSVKLFRTRYYLYVYGKLCSLIRNEGLNIFRRKILKSRILFKI